MDSYLLRRCQGFSLIELVIAMGVAAILASAVTPVAIRSMEIKAAEKTGMEMLYVQEAVRNFYKDHKNKWPNSFKDLIEEGYLNRQWSFLNPWNNPYQLTPLDNSMSLATEVPSYMSDVVKSKLIGAGISEDKKTVVIVINQPFLPSIEKRIIVAWGGAIADIPSGWVLCDGQNGTPDLRDKFIVGASVDDGDVAKTNITGILTQSGAPDGLTGSHVLDINEMPKHQHASYGEAFPEQAKWGVAPYGAGHLGDGHSDRDNYYYLTEPKGGDLGHTHTIPYSSIIPSYYALAFIMKL